MNARVRYPNRKYACRAIHIDGERFPDGYTPMEIKNGKYPRAYYPNTEKLAPDEMRVTALVTGMPHVTTGHQKASATLIRIGQFLQHGIIHVFFDKLRQRVSIQQPILANPGGKLSKFLRPVRDRSARSREKTGK